MSMNGRKRRQRQALRWSPWTLTCSDPDATLNRSDQVKDGRPPFDAVRMFEIPALQSSYALIPVRPGSENLP